MSIIDTTFFVGELNIANTDTEAASSYLQLFIDKYEAAYLRILLGADLYARYVAGINLVPIPSEWTDLQNQLVTIDGTSKVSPIANYIYFFFIRRATYSNSGTGLTQPKYENATAIDSKIETSRAWNEMAVLSFKVYKYLKANATIYGPLPYDLRCYNDDYLELWFDWSFWWGFFPFNLRNRIPEIYRPLNVLGI